MGKESADGGKVLLAARAVILFVQMRRRIHMLGQGIGTGTGTAAVRVGADPMTTVITGLRNFIGGLGAVRRTWCVVGDQFLGNQVGLPSTSLPALHDLGDR